MTRCWETILDQPSEAELILVKTVMPNHKGTCQGQLTRLNLIITPKALKLLQVAREPRSPTPIRQQRKARQTVPSSFHSKLELHPNHMRYLMMSLTLSISLQPTDRVHLILYPESTEALKSLNKTIWILKMETKCKILGTMTLKFCNIWRNSRCNSTKAQDSLSSDKMKTLGWLRSCGLRFDQTTMKWMVKFEMLWTIEQGH